MSNSIKVTLKNISKSFDNIHAVDAINYEFAPGTLTTLLGPSGCGKTTLLRLISGLEIATSGEIWYGDEEVTDLSATYRDVGMVFQSYALFPHMTVGQNVGYGLKILKTPKDEILKKVKEVLKMVDMDGYQPRYPHELSGGQQQRVAVARAMILSPKVLLFDEPLSNIDSKLRRSMRDDIRRLQQDTGITSIYVTHDQSEALAVSDEIIIMNEGRIEQVGAPRSLFNEPKTGFVANFIGESNVIDATLEGEGKDKILLIGDASIAIQKENIKSGPVKLSLRPEMFEIIPREENTEETLSGKIIQNAYMGQVVEYSIETAAGILFTKLPSNLKEFQLDEAVSIRIKKEEIIIIPS